MLAPSTSCIAITAVNSCETEPILNRVLASFGLPFFGSRMAAPTERRYLMSPFSEITTLPWAKSLAASASKYASSFAAGNLSAATAGAAASTAATANRARMVKLPDDVQRARVAAHGQRARPNYLDDVRALAQVADELVDLGLGGRELDDEALRR